MIKITYSIFARTDLEPEEVRRRWMDEHGDMVRDFAPRLRLVRYVQTLRHPHPLEATMSASRGQAPRYPFGMAELYWNSIEDLEWSFSDKDARDCYRILLEDEKRFAERGEWTPWIGVERPVIREAAPMRDGTLFDPVDIGGVTLPNRVVMAPMTRSRADFDGNVSPMAAEYYAQRASAGLIVTEAIAVSRQSHGYPFTPGIWSAEQQAGWRKVTEGVHAAGGRICAQLWHVGRVYSPKNNPAALEAVGPSAVAPKFRIFTKDGVEWIGTPRELSNAEVKATVRDFAEAAKAALDAGLDMVEFHGANGYLIEQFLSDEANVRTDEYGGTHEKRLRFLAEILEATREVAGSLSQIGLRLSPFGDFNGIRHSDPMQAYCGVLDLIRDKGLAYLHVVEPSISGDGSRRVANGDQAPDVLAIARERYAGPVIACADYDRSKAEVAIADGRADLIAFGRPYISNPDLVERMRFGAPLADYDRSTFYTRGPKGYTDYPALDAATS